MENRLSGFISEKKKYQPVSIRTVAIDLIVLRNLLKSALDQGIILELPRFPKLKVPPSSRKEMVTDAEFLLLIEGCSKAKPCGEPVTKNGSQLSDLLILLDFCGIRESEAYAIAWIHVDFMGKKLWVGVDPDFNAMVASIGTGGKTKNRKSRYIDMSIPLEEHLLQMRKRNLYAQFKDLPRAMAEMGHTNPRTFLNHYRERVKPSEAEKYWQIKPNH